MAGSATLYTAFIELGYKGFDKVNQHMQNAARAVQAGMNSISSEMRVGQQYILDFTKSGSPMAFNTLAGSIELLKARIGSSFGPVILSVSKSVQDLSKWIRDLDPETKKQIATWTTLGVVGTGLALTVGNLAFKVGQLGVSMISFAIKNPMAAPLAAIAAAAGYAWLKLDQLEKKLADISDTANRIKSGNINEDDMQKSYVGRSLMKENDTEKRLAMAQRMLKIAEDRRKELAASVGDYGSGENDNLAMGLDTMGLLGTGKDKSLLKIQTEEYAQLTRDIEIAKQVISSGKSKPKITESPKEKSDLLLAGMGGMLGGRSGATSLGSAYGNINNMALGMDPIQRQMLLEQQKSNNNTMKTASNTQGIFEMLFGMVKN